MCSAKEELAKLKPMALEKAVLKRAEEKLQEGAKTAKTYKGGRQVWVRVGHHKLLPGQPTGLAHTWRIRRA